MQAVRGRGDLHAADLSAAVRRSTDWTSYVRSAPLACAAGAAALGYLAVPSRPRSPKVVRVKGSSRRGRKGGKGGDDDAGTSPTATVERPVSGKGPWMGVLAVLGNVAVRAGTAYLSQKAGTMFGEAAAEPERPDPKPSAAAADGPPRGADARHTDRPFGGPR